MHETVFSLKIRPVSGDWTSRFITLDALDELDAGDVVSLKLGGGTRVSTQTLSDAVLGGAAVS